MPKSGTIATFLTYSDRFIPLRETSDATAQWKLSCGSKEVQNPLTEYQHFLAACQPNRQTRLFVHLKKRGEGPAPVFKQKKMHPVSSVKGLNAEMMDDDYAHLMDWSAVPRNEGLLSIALTSKHKEQSDLHLIYSNGTSFPPLKKVGTYQSIAGLKLW